MPGSGTSSITGEESIMFADNFSFDGTKRGGKLTEDLQVWVGSTVAPHVRKKKLVAGTGIDIDNTDPEEVVFSSDSGVFSWNEVTGTSQSLSVNNGYIGNNAGTITMTLPATASIGDEICFAQKGAGVIQVAQNAGQTIHTTTASTTTGVGGSLSTIDQWSSFCLICVTEDTDWMLKSGSHGSLLVV